MTLTISSARRLLDAAEKRLLAGAMGDSPETAIPVHLLRKGGGDVHLLGDLPDFRAVIIEDYSVGPELMAYGNDAYGLWSILRQLDDWDAINVPMAVARELAGMIQDEMNVPLELVDDIYQLPSGPVPSFPNQDVRLLTLEDRALLEAAPPDILDSFDDDLQAVLEEELIAAAIADGQIVAVGSTYGLQEKYVDLAVSTLAPYRCRGYARAAASLVAVGTQKAGRIPIWSCAPTNIGSLQVAYRLGFREMSRRVNILVVGV